MHSNIRSKGNTVQAFTVFTLLTILAPLASAQRQTFTVSPDASDVKITLNTTHEVVHGAFRVQAGSVEFDRNDSKMTGSVVVYAGSGKTGNGSRDKRMNKEILKVEQYTAISFAPASYTGVIAPSGDSTIQVTGTFKLLDVPHQITVPMVIHMEGPAATARTHFSIPYVQWGLKDPSLLFWRADKEVSVDLTLTGQLAN